MLDCEKLKLKFKKANETDNPRRKIIDIKYFITNLFIE